MKSKIPKVLHKVLDKTMIDYVIETSKDINAEDIMVIVGHQSAMVKSIIGSDVKYAYQKEQLGTGHAVIQAMDFIEDNENILILYGDTPLIKSETLEKLINIHNKEKNYATVISSFVDDPKGYGRIVRESGIFKKIVEQKDTTDYEDKINEINTGVYIFNSNALKDALKNLSNDNAQKEYYLTDTLELIKNTGNKVGIMIADDSSEFLGVNSKLQLATVSNILKNRINEYHMLNGITIEDPNTTYIGKNVKIGEDTVILPGTIIEGNTVIGSDCIIGPYSRITSSVIKDCVSIAQSTVLSSEINNYTTVGPFAYIRPNSKIGEHVKVGDFVEIKNSNIDDNTKISHLTYVGDSDVGKNVNFGCGTVTVNYDGKNKYRTTIEDNAFIGCNTNLIAPVKVGENASTGAGSTITDDVPNNSLAISRVKEQINKLDYNIKK
ncbi:MAG: bifunctional UDP-N-acetylglucosamine diphosphorylase/glucosamine-1-phosphate N-acetyltransferase GlmU [Eubacteriales bacterium]|nr:bifunctional UDP-N-acetylglucosamine diphosphorylase/glucosamine-1-phosphate N-acetyltransferase GlmU [Eubacteriales bacterium]